MTLRQEATLAAPRLPIQAQVDPESAAFRLRKASCFTQFDDPQPFFLKSFKRSVGKKSRRSSCNEHLTNRNPFRLDTDSLVFSESSSALGFESPEIPLWTEARELQQDEFCAGVSDCQAPGIDKLSFNIFQYNDDELQEFAAYMLFEFSPESNDPSVFSNYLELVGNIRNLYNNCAYHSFRHAVDVTQAMYALLMDANLKRLLATNHPVILLLTCLLHDVGHNGQTNNVLRRSNHDLALKYGEHSTLEHYHADLAKKIIEENNVAEMLDIEVSVVDLIEELILATDIEQHAAFMTKMTAFMQIDQHQYGSGMARGGHDWQTSESKKLLCTLLLKICDISNLARREEVSSRWGAKLAEESLALYEHCQRIGLVLDQPLPATSEQLQAQRSCDFSESYVKPMYQVLGRICPTASASFYVGLNRNTSNWKSIGTIVSH